jgi:hypothetical protein
MRKIAILAVFVAGVLAARPAQACRSGNPCPLIIEVAAYGLGAAMLGAYGYGTGYYAYHDLTDDTQSVRYAVGEVAFNGLAGSVATIGMVKSIQAGDVKTTLVLTPFALAHDAMALHGLWSLQKNYKDPGHAPDDTLEWIAGIAYGANTLVWTAGLANNHGRTYGIVEAAVNAPLAGGLAYLAIDRARDGERAQTLVFGGLALVSGGLAYHGIKTAIAPTTPGIDLLGTDVMPIAVSDGREVAPGLAMSGTW